MNPRSALLALLVASTALVALAPTAEADVTVCVWGSWQEGCRLEETVLESEEVRCDLVVFVPVVQCSRRPASDGRLPA